MAREPAAALAEEPLEHDAAVTAAWVKWYGEAMGSVSALSVAGPSAVLQSRIDAAVARLRSL